MIASRQHASANKTSLARPVPRRRLRRSAVTLLTIALSGAVLTPLLGTRLLNFGIWNQAEPVLIGIYACAAVAALALCLLAMASSPLAGTVRHPVVLTAVGLALWSLVAGLFNKVPGAAIFGSPELGEGSLWFLSLAVLTAATATIRRLHRPASIVAGGALVLSTVVAAATMLYLGGIADLPVPLYFADYQAFSGLYVGVAGYVLLRRRSRLWAGMAAASGIAIVATSNNNAGFAALFLAAPLGVLSLWLLYRFAGGRWARLGGAGLTVLAVVAITALVVGVDFQRLADSGGPLAGPANSVVSRHHLLGIVVDQVAATPRVLIGGLGWGRFSESFTAQLPIEWVNLRDDAASWGEETGLLRAGFWDAVNRVDFHSHNSFLQAVLEAGVPGGLLYLMLFLWLPLIGRRETGLLPAYVAMGAAMMAALWFQMPENLPFMALCWGVLIGPMASRRAAWRLAAKISRPLAVAGTAVAALLLVLGTGWLVRFVPMAFYFSAGQAAPLYRDGVRQPCAARLDDLGRGGLHLGHRLGTLVAYSRREILAGRTPEPNTIDILRGLTCAGEQYLDEYGGLRLGVVALNERAEFAFLDLPSDMADIREGLSATWRARLNAVLAQAPRRTDLAIPYLLDRLAAGDEAELGDLSRRLYARHPQDPVALWFSGLSLIAHPQGRDDGLGRMRAALAGGIERLMPVDPEIKAQLVPVTVDVVPQRRMTIATTGGEATFDVTVVGAASADYARLTSRTSMPARGGMVVTGYGTGTADVALDQTFISYDLLFVGTDGRIARIVAATMPRATSPVSVEGDLAAVVWLNGGIAASHAIAIGDRVILR